MRILREYLGGSEVIDLASPQGEREWLDVVQDVEAAEELAERIADEGVVVINATEPEFIERYTKLEEAHAQDAD